MTKEKTCSFSCEFEVEIYFGMKSDEEPVCVTLQLEGTRSSGGNHPDEKPIPPHTEDFFVKIVVPTSDPKKPKLFDITNLFLDDDKLDILEKYWLDEICRHDPGPEPTRNSYGYYAKEAK